MSASDGIDISDRELFLLPVTSSSSSSSSAPDNTSNSGIGITASSRVQLGRLRRLPLELARRAPLLCALCSVSSGVTWIVKGFFVCMGMMIMGGVGSFTLHQMMSPQIESLIKQRSALQKELDALQMQVENITSIAESRLETIHLLEQELEKQAVDAAAAAAAFAAQSGPDYPGNGGGVFRNGHRVPGGAGMAGGSFVLPTIVYAGLLGFIILVTVVYRVYRIVQVETRENKRAMQTHSSDHHHRHHLHRGDSTLSLLPLGPSSPTNPSSASVGIGHDNDDDDDDVLRTIAADSAVRSDAAQGLSALAGNESASQQCYKRSQPLSPVNRLMHV